MAQADVIAAKTGLCASCDNARPWLCVGCGNCKDCGHAINCEEERYYRPEKPAQRSAKETA